MPSIYFHPSNCGLRDLVISGYDPKEVMLHVCRACVNPKYVSLQRVTENKFSHIAAHVIFSQAARKGVTSYGDKLAAFITENGLGSVLKTEQILNPDHGPNYITAYVWTPDNKALEAWWEKNKPKDIGANPGIGAAAGYGHVAPMCCPGLPQVKDKEIP